MGADKNSFPKRELSLCPKFTTKDSHMSLPRSRFYNGPTNPRDKPQAVPKWKHDSRSKGLSCPAKALADCPRGWGGRSARTGQTVRGPRADSPLNAIEPPEEHLEMRTVRTLPADCPRATCAARTVRDLWGDGPPNILPQNFGTSKDLRVSLQELDEHTKNSHPADGLRATDGQSASPRTERPKVKTEKSTSPIPPWISQTAGALEERFRGEVKRP
jgi:hypothetical protein